MLTLSLYMALLMPGAQPQAAPSFDAVLDECVSKMKETQQKNVKDWGMDKIDKWSWDEMGNLSFVLKDGTRVTARYQIIGSYNIKDESWIWAWNNPEVKSDLAHDAKKVQQYGQAHDIDILKTPGWKGESAMSWKVAAFALHHCEASGIFAAPVSEKLQVFLLFREIKISPPDR